jgi:hypothetical protein
MVGKKEPRITDAQNPRKLSTGVRHIGVVILTAKIPCD